MGLAPEMVFSGQLRQERRDMVEQERTTAQHVPPRVFQQTPQGYQYVQFRSLDETRRTHQSAEASDERSMIATYIILSVMGLLILMILVWLRSQVMPG